MLVSSYYHLDTDSSYLGRGNLCEELLPTDWPIGKSECSRLRGMGRGSVFSQLMIDVGGHNPLWVVTFLGLGVSGLYKKAGAGEMAKLGRVRLTTENNKKAG